MPRPLLGERPMTPAERAARRRQREMQRTERLETVVRDLLAEAETGRISAKTVADKCRTALGLVNRS